MHIFLCKYILWIAFFVQIRAFVIETVCSFEEESAVLCTSKGSMQESTIKNELIKRKYGYRSLFFRRICQVYREAQTLVFTIKCLFFVYCDLQNFSVLSKVLKSSQKFLFGNVGGYSYDVTSITLHNSDLAKLLLTLVFGSSALRWLFF